MGSGVARGGGLLAGGRRLLMRTIGGDASCRCSSANLRCCHARSLRPLVMWPQFAVGSIKEDYLGVISVPM